MLYTLGQELIILTLGLDFIQLRLCPCAPAPVQLIKQGLFPCSPVYPALAVSLDMLEFVSMLFVHLALNETAWCDALTVFLARRGHVFEAQDSLRRRFASAFGQYQVLVRVVKAEVDKQMDVARHMVLSQDSFVEDDIPPEPISLPDINDSTPITSRLYVSALSADGRSARKPSASTVEDSTQSRHITSPLPVAGSHTSNMHATPSDYLRSRCPLCFGGSDGSGERKL